MTEQAEWHYKVDEQEFGPLSLAQMKRLRVEGRLHRLDQVSFRNGHYQAAENFRELGFSFAPEPLRVPLRQRVASIDESLKRIRRDVWWLYVLAVLGFALALCSGFVSIISDNR